MSEVINFRREKLNRSLEASIEARTMLSRTRTKLADARVAATWPLAAQAQEPGMPIVSYALPNNRYLRSPYERSWGWSW